MNTPELQSYESKTPCPERLRERSLVSSIKLQETSYEAQYCIVESR